MSDLDELAFLNEIAQLATLIDESGIDAGLTAVIAGLWSLMIWTVGATFLLVLIALALRRESLARLREEPRCALTIMGAGNIALTAHATASIVQDPMEVSDKVAAVCLDVEEIQDHTQPRFAIESSVKWRWCELEARERDAAIRAALTELAEQQA